MNQGLAPIKAFKANVAPEGYLTIPVNEMTATIIGGPFEAFKGGAFGVCLNAHAQNAKSTDLMIPIPDFQPLPQAKLVQSIARIWHQIEQEPDRPIFVGCGAGFGRTGMIIACLAKMAGVIDPVAYVRQSYNPRAVETAAQEQAVEDLDIGKVRELVALMRPAPALPEIPAKYSIFSVVRKKISFLFR